MSKKIIFLLFVITTFYTGANSEPVQCYDRECPNETTACKKVTKTTDDKKNLEVIVSCLDAQNMVLKDYIESKPNPYGSSTTFQSTSFSGTYISGNGGPVNLNIKNDVGPQIEDFSY